MLFMKAHLFIPCLVILSVSVSAEMYKWVDDKGKVHFGDSVPVQYQQQADTLNQFKAPTEQQKTEARQAAERTKALANKYRYEAADKRSRESFAAELAEQKKQAKNSAPKKGCAAKLKSYHDSAQCFNNFRNANGSLKGGAANKCNDVARPDECF